MENDYNVSWLDFDPTECATYKELEDKRIDTELERQRFEEGLMKAGVSIHNIVF